MSLNIIRIKQDNIISINIITTYIHDIHKICFRLQVGLIYIYNLTYMN